MKLFGFKKENRRLFLTIFGIKMNFVLPFGGNNKIIIVDKKGKEHRVPFIFGIKTHFHGSNAILKVYSPMPRFIKCDFTFDDNSVIEIGSSDDYIREMEVMTEAKGSELIIGKNFGLKDGYFLFHKKENNKIEIGNDTKARYLTVRTCDGHKIRDLNTNEIINPDGDIKIGNNVWLTGFNTILKNVIIPDYTIVANHAVVTKAFTEPYTVIGGLPAKVVKRNVKWEF